MGGLRRLVPYALLVGVAGCTSRRDPGAIALPPNVELLAGSADGRLRGAPCPVEIPANLSARCGELDVPEDRSITDSPLVTLPVVVLKSPHPTGLPVVYLDGGPGGPGIDDVLALMDWFAPILAEHDLVAFDQRGTGYTEPSIDCHEVADMRQEYMFESPDQQLAHEIDGLELCYYRLTHDAIDLGRFNSRENAADVDDLRAHLGYPQWNVFGVSYGTRLAIDVERYFPNGAASVVIDSVLPPQVDFLSSSVADAMRSFRATFAGCAAQADCAAAYPDLENVLTGVLTKLETTSGTVDLGGGVSALIGPGDVLGLMFQLSYSADAVAYLPEYIYEFSAGDFSVFRSFYTVEASLRAAGATFSESMYLSVICSEYAAFTSRAAISAGEAGYDPLYVSSLSSGVLLDLCAVWNVPAVGAAEREPASGTVPTLVLSGAYDPVTPPAWSELAASTLGAAFYLPFAAQAHGAFADPCGGDLLNRFWADPSSNPDAACPARSAPLEFYVGPGRLPAGASPAHLDIAPLVGLPDEVVDRLRHPIR